MNNKILSLFLCILFIVTSFSVAAMTKTSQIKNADDLKTSCHIKIYKDNAQTLVSNLLEEGFDVLRDKITESTFELIVTPNEIKKIESIGIDFEIISRGRPFIEIQKEMQKNPSFIPPGYSDLTEIIDEMNETESNYPDICKVYDLTETYGCSETYEGRHIYAIKISDNVEDDEDEPSFLMVSCHHAREIGTPVIALYSIEQFTSEYGSDPDITSIVDDYEIWISPVWNPDGYEYCYYYDNMWRKNRRPPNGVDLNRNYPFGWNSGCSGSTDPYSETYKGPSCASEPETQTMIAFTNDRHFAKVLDYHSYGSEVLYGYCCHSHPFSSFFETEAVALSNAAGYYGSIRVPSAEGENYEWQIWGNGTYANLMETHVEFQPSYSSALAEAEKVFPGTMWMLERPISVSGHVVDSITGEPLNAKIEIEDVSFSNDEKFFCEPNFGRYHLFLPSGTYNIKFECENYNSQTHEVTVTSTSEEILEVELARINCPPNKPSIDGPSIGKSGEEITFHFTATDPDDDDIDYYVKWGDGNSIEWDGPHKSGETVTFSHIWERKGTYDIWAKARDVYGEESGIEVFTITIEKKSKNVIGETNIFKLLLYRLFQNFQKLIT